MCIRDRFPASEENVEQYVNPENLVSGYEKYQFMDLSVSNNVDSATLDTYLKGKGVLDGHGSEFKKAADVNNVSCLLYTSNRGHTAWNYKHSQS